MKTLASLFASILIATSLFVSTAYAVGDSQMVDEQVVYSSSGGKYHQCFLEGNVGCK